MTPSRALDTVGRMDLDELKDFLTRRGCRFAEEPIEHGVRLRCASGEVFTHYTKRGHILVQGRTTELAQAVKQWQESGIHPDAEGASAVVRPAAASRGPSRTVFVVYGHDTEARDALELLLRRMKLDPIVLANLPAGGETIIEKLDRYLGEHSNVGFACVLLTPVDEGFVMGKPEERRYSARQNVILELGLVLARLGRGRVEILHKGSVELPSDINGLIYIAFEERVDEVHSKLFAELTNAGYRPDVSGT
jgi:predicted nucleotide-binding protein